MTPDTWGTLLDKAKSLCLRGMPETTQLTFVPDFLTGKDGEIRENEHYFGITGMVHFQ